MILNWCRCVTGVSSVVPRVFFGVSSYKGAIFFQWSTDIWQLVHMAFYTCINCSTYNYSFVCMTPCSRWARLPPREPNTLLHKKWYPPNEKHPLQSKPPPSSVKLPSSKTVTVLLTLSTPHTKRLPFPHAKASSTRMESQLCMRTYLLCVWRASPICRGSLLACGHPALHAEVHVPSRYVETSWNLHSLVVTLAFIVASTLVCLTSWETSSAGTVTFTRLWLWKGRGVKGVAS